MDIDINFRKNQLFELQNYMKDVDTEVTMILQNLQWDRKYLMQHKTMSACQYDTNHRVPPGKLMEHENGCFLKSQGYIEKDRLLPSPIDPSANTLVKLDSSDIADIIKNASQCQPLFRTGPGCSGHQPLTIERLQATYTADERCAIHDAVVNRVPSCDDPCDLALLSTKDDSGKESEVKSHMKILAELRDMRRRRTKYRVAAKTRNYSDVLRDVITTQMELYTQVHGAENQICKTKSELDNSRENVDIPNEINARRLFDETSNRSVRRSEGHSSTFVRDAHNISRHSRKRDGHEARKRKPNDSDNVCISTTQKHNESAANEADNNNSKSKRRGDGRARSPEYYRNRSKHREHYDSRSRYREKEYDRKRQTRTEDGRKYCSELKERYHSHERHNSGRVRGGYEHYRYKTASPKRTDDADREERYEWKIKLEKEVRIKKEKDDSRSGCSSAEDEAGCSDVSLRSWQTRYCNVRKVKVENKMFVKYEKDHLNRLKDVAAYGSEQDHNAKNKDKTNHEDKRSSERTETYHQRVKLEKN